MLLRGPSFWYQAQIFEKKIHFFPSLSREPLEAHHSPPLLPRHMGRASAKHAPQAPRVGAHDVILTGLDEEGDSTDDEMPPLEPLEGAAQLGVVWLRGHGKDGCDPTTSSAKLALQLRATQLGHAQLGGPQAGGAQLGGPHLDVGLID